MKKLISIFLSTSLSLMFLTTPVLAEKAIRESNANEQLTIYLELDYMIKEKVFLQGNRINEVKELSAKASDKYRVLLLDNYEKNVIVYPVVSFFIPSLGNWILGDYLNALLIDVTLWVATLLTTGHNFFEGNALSISGSFLFLAAWLYSLITSFTYADNYNKKLYEALNENDLKINFYKKQDNSTFTINFVSLKY